MPRRPPCVLLCLITLAAARAAAQTSADPSPFARQGLTLVAPAAPGGGWDQLAREMQRALETERLAARVQVENIPGAAGTIGLAQLVSARRGEGDVLLVNGLVMLGAILWNESPVSLAQTTPIARVTGEYEVVAVPAASPHRDMQSLVAALRTNPAAISWGGGSAGGTDHILAGLIVAAAGVDPRRTNYIAFSGGGEAVTALVGGQVTAGISGYSEFAQHIASGRLRAIAISSGRRLPTPDVPTLIEQGLDVELANWRAVVAPPGVSSAQRAALTTLVEQMARSETWRATLARQGWTDGLLVGDEFAAFLDDERVRIGRIVARLRGASGNAAAASAGEWVFPVIVIVGCLVALVLLGLGAGRTRVLPYDRAVVWRVVAVLAAFALLLTRVGFVIAGTLLFVATAGAFGSRQWRRDTVVAIALCGGIYVAFTMGLGIKLP